MTHYQSIQEKRSLVTPKILQSNTLALKNKQIKEKRFSSKVSSQYNSSAELKPKKSIAKITFDKVDKKYYNKN